jgi:hypothetical protein
VPAKRQFTSGRIRRPSRSPRPLLSGSLIPSSPSERYWPTVQGTVLFLKGSERPGRPRRGLPPVVILPPELGIGPAVRRSSSRRGGNAPDDRPGTSRRTQILWEQRRADPNWRTPLHIRYTSPSESHTSVLVRSWFTTPLRTPTRNGRPLSDRLHRSSSGDISSPCFSDDMTILHPIPLICRTASLAIPPCPTATPATASICATTAITSGATLGFGFDRCRESIGSITTSVRGVDTRC